MIHECLNAEQFGPMLPHSSTGATLSTYARPKEGFLAESGGRWGVLIMPGGGYELTSRSEGEPVALAFLGAGIQAFLLNYSVSPDRWPQALLETAAAIAYLRKHAKKYGIDPNKIAVCGFSAGGHLAGCMANLWQDTMFEKLLDLSSQQVRPNAAVLCYPVITMGKFGSKRVRENLFEDGPVVSEASLENSVTINNPPTFLWSTVSDPLVPVENTLLYASSLREQGVSFELHVFPKGPHAMALATEQSSWQKENVNTQVKNWHNLCVGWLKGLEL
jgi:acetyl esterase/lipase